MAAKKMIVGNWKLNKTLEEAVDWVEGVKIKLKGVEFTNKIKVIVCPSYPYLLGMVDLLDKTGIEVGAQDVSQFDEGTYTGEVSAKMLSEIVNYVLIGHSERRKFFQENLSVMKTKLNKALNYKMTPIVCISDNVWEDGLPSPKYSEKYFLHQMTYLTRGLKPEEKQKIIWGYEPPSAISKQKHGVGTGQAANINDVLTAVEKIKKVTPQNKVIYGGSVNAENVTTYLSQDLIDGVLPGSASLHAQDFAAMISASVGAR